jgi:hypothetical protein
MHLALLCTELRNAHDSFRLLLRRRAAVLEVTMQDGRVSCLLRLHAATNAGTLIPPYGRDRIPYRIFRRHSRRTLRGSSTP